MRLKRTGFWPIYIFAIDPNMVFFAWKSEVDQETREQDQIDSLFEKEKKKSKAEVPSTISETGGDDGLEDGSMDWMGFRQLIAKTPGLEKLCPSVLAPVLDKTKEAHDRKNILGWMGVEEFQSKCADKSWVI